MHRVQVVHEACCCAAHQCIRCCVAPAGASWGACAMMGSHGAAAKCKLQLCLLSLVASCMQAARAMEAVTRPWLRPPPPFRFTCRPADTPPPGHAPGPPADTIWHSKERYSAAAPRCLPCHGPARPPGRPPKRRPNVGGGAEVELLMPPLGCPCTPELACNFTLAAMHRSDAAVTRAGRPFQWCPESKEWGFPDNYPTVCDYPHFHVGQGIGGGGGAGGRGGGRVGAPNAGIPGAGVWGLGVCVVPESWVGAHALRRRLGFGHVFGALSWPGAPHHHHPCCSAAPPTCRVAYPSPAPGCFLRRLPSPSRAVRAT